MFREGEGDGDGWEGRYRVLYGILISLTFVYEGEQAFGVSEYSSKKIGVPLFRLPPSLRVFAEILGTLQPRLVYVQMPLQFV